MNEARGIPLIPMLPSWVKPTPFRGTETKAMPLTPTTLFRCLTWSPRLWLLLCMTRSRLCTTVLPASPTTAARAGPGKTPSPKNQRGTSLLERGRNSLVGPKEKYNQNRKAMANSPAGPAAFSCISTQSFFPRNRIKTGMVEKYHFILTMTVKTTNMKIAIIYSIHTFSLKTARVDTRFQWCFGKSCAWLGRAAGPAAPGSADPPGKAGVRKSIPDFEMRGGEGAPPCKSSSRCRARGSSRTAQTAGKEGINTNLTRGSWLEPKAPFSPSLPQQNSARTFYVMCFSLF